LSWNANEFRRKGLGMGRLLLPVTGGKRGQLPGCRDKRTPSGCGNLHLFQDLGTEWLLVIEIEKSNLQVESFRNFLRREKGSPMDERFAKFQGL
jgi:hypothetical protein